MGPAARLCSHKVRASRRTSQGGHRRRLTCSWKAWSHSSLKPSGSPRSRSSTSAITWGWGLGERVVGLCVGGVRWVGVGGMRWWAGGQCACMRWRVGRRRNGCMAQARGAPTRTAGAPLRGFRAHLVKLLEVHGRAQIQLAGQAPAFRLVLRLCKAIGQPAQRGAGFVMTHASCAAPRHRTLGAASRWAEMPAPQDAQQGRQARPSRATVTARAVRPARQPPSSERL